MRLRGAQKNSSVLFVVSLFVCGFILFFFVCFFTIPVGLWDYNPRHGLSWVFLASCVVGKALLGKKKEEGKQNKLELSCRIICQRKAICILPAPFKCLDGDGTFNVISFL